MSDHSTPRIDGSLLEEYKNRTVRIIGKIESINLNNNTLKLYTPSENKKNLIINVTTTPDLEFEQGKWFEIIGRVMDDLSLRAIDIQNFGNDINEKAISGLVKFAQKYSIIFHD